MRSLQTARGISQGTLEMEDEGTYGHIDRMYMHHELEKSAHWPTGHSYVRAMHEYGVHVHAAVKGLHG